MDNIILQIIYDIIELKLWYHGSAASATMISVTSSSDIIGLWYQPWWWPWYWLWYWLWYHSQLTCNVRWQITQFRIWNHERFQCGLKSWSLWWRVPYAQEELVEQSVLLYGDEEGIAKPDFYREIPDFSPIFFGLKFRV